MLSRSIFKMCPLSYLIIAATLTISITLIAAPAFSLSSNQCSSCHSNYNQQLDILEGNSQNRIPTAIQVGETQTVNVVIQNINNAPRYNLFSSVSLTLNSQNSHFSITTPTFNIGTLPTGTATAIWQITGVSPGSDVLLISASATNTHENLQYSDSYSPSPSITIVTGSNPTPVPTTTPTSTPTSIPTITPSPAPTPVQTLTPTATPRPTSTPTASPTPKPTVLPAPTASPNSASSPKPTSTPTPAASPITPTSNDNHELNSTMIYIHPPLAIIGYILIFLFTLLIIQKKYVQKRIAKLAGLGLWFFTSMGLFTGMLWAQFAWGSYWSWDPKETMTLALFLTVSAGQIVYFEEKFSAAKWLALLSCVLTILTGSTSFLIAGLHSFG